eukprot:g68603.t1
MDVDKAKHFKPIMSWMAYHNRRQCILKASPNVRNLVYRHFRSRFYSRQLMHYFKDSSYVEASPPPSRSVLATVQNLHCLAHRYSEVEYYGGYSVNYA